MPQAASTTTTTPSKGSDRSNPLAISVLENKTIESYRVYFVKQFIRYEGKWFQGADGKVFKLNITQYCRIMGIKSKTFQNWRDAMGVTKTEHTRTDNLKREGSGEGSDEGEGTSSAVVTNQVLKNIRRRLENAMKEYNKVAANISDADYADLTEIEAEASKLVKAARKAAREHRPVEVAA